MKIINVIYKISVLFYILLFVMVHVRWLIFNRPIAEHFGFFVDLIIIFSFMILIIGLQIALLFFKNPNKYFKLRYILKILLIIISMLGVYYIILVTYINVDISVIHYWESGEWKW